MRNNLAMKTSREVTSTTNDQDAAARTLGLGLGQHTMAKSEDESESCKDRPEVAQVMVAGEGSNTAATTRATAWHGVARAEQRRRGKGSTARVNAVRRGGLCSAAELCRRPAGGGGQGAAEA
jgi:hypothetical protein